MTGLLKSANRYGAKVIPKEIRDHDPLNTEVTHGIKSLRFGPKKPDPTPVVPLPDQDAIDLATRRRRSRRLGSRASTALTGGDTDPVG